MKILIPDLGDIDDVEVTEFFVAEGTAVCADEPVAIVESDKAAMEIVAGADGVVTKFLVSIGDRLREGDALAELELAAVDQHGLELKDSAQKGSAAQQSQVAEGGRETEAAESAVATASELLPDSQIRPASIAPKSSVGLANTPALDVGLGSSDSAVYAGPATRRLARELGVQLSQVQGSGARHRVTKDDLKAFVKSQLSGASESKAKGVIPAVPEVDFARFGEIEVQLMTRIQRQVAVNMHRSWLNVPHVTQHSQADIQELDQFRKALADQAKEQGLRLTPLPFIVSACCAQLQRQPQFNSSLAAGGEHLVKKSYINVGIAVATPDGLVVPVIRAADQMGIWQLAKAIDDIAAKARNKKLGLSDLSGGTFTVSSLGNLGGTGFTPIVNTPEVAILGVGRASMEPVWQGDELVPNLHLPLCLSYDHRVINGVDGGEFIQGVARTLADASSMAL